MINDLKSLQIFDRITFFENGHLYKIGNEQAPLSVSKLIEFYKPKFEADFLAERTAKKLGTTKEDILETWRVKNLFSTQQGTIFHFYVDNYFRNRIYPYEDLQKANATFDTETRKKLNDALFILIKQFDNFYNDHKHLLPIKNEFVLGDLDDTKICGTLDMLVYNTKLNGYEIYDFKTNKAFEFKSKYYKKFNPPLNHLHVCENDSYALQMSLYQTIIEKYTTLNIVGNNAVWFNINNDNYKVFPMKDYRKEAQFMFDNYVNLSNEVK